MWYVALRDQQKSIRKGQALGLEDHLSSCFSASFVHLFPAYLALAQRWSREPPRASEAPSMSSVEDGPAEPGSEGGQFQQGHSAGSSVLRSLLCMGRNPAFSSRVKPFSSRFWERNQPDNWRHSSGEVENCVHMKQLWNDMVCGATYHWVCEKSTGQAAA